MRVSSSSSFLTSFFCCFVGASGSCEANVCKNVQVHLPSSSLLTLPPLSALSVDPFEDVPFVLEVAVVDTTFKDSDASLPSFSSEALCFQNERSRISFLTLPKTSRSARGASMIDWRRTCLCLGHALEDLHRSLRRTFEAWTDGGRETNVSRVRKRETVTALLASCLRRGTFG